MPNKTQYIAANIGRGIDAKKAPNLPEIEMEKSLITWVTLKCNGTLQTRIEV